MFQSRTWVDGAGFGLPPLAHLFRPAGLVAMEKRGSVSMSPLTVKKMQKSHFFVSGKQNFFRPSAIIGVAMNNFVKWLGCGGRIRACLKIRNDAVFVARAGWQGATKENTLHGSSTEEQRRQPALAAKTLRAAGLLLCPKIKSPSRSIIPNFQTGSESYESHGSHPGGSGHIVTDSNTQ
jgi:hypothetical protein